MERFLRPMLEGERGALIHDGAEVSELRPHNSDPRRARSTATRYQSGCDKRAKWSTGGPVGAGLSDRDVVTDHDAPPYQRAS